ncbi:hypothetical protein [Roseibium aggregatum]|uniref:hypothetical protein n=1 Tax=Roseibium aggregatum TaxID=187304 RepID=UPI001AD8A388|nr:hypothetical protein [Roseibium aggregatum]
MPQRPAALLPIAVVLVSVFCALPARAQVPPEEEAGWQSDVGGLSHFSGLRCPDTIGSFYRVKAMASDGVSLAGCIYTGQDGLTAVLRKHLLGTGRREALAFSRNYKSAGFEPVKMSGAAASGISFRTRNWTPSSLLETFWYFSGEKADYTLWIAYTLPAQEGEVGPALEVFTDALALQN